MVFGNPTWRRGHTITEAMIALVLVMIAMSMAMAGWLYMARGEKRNATQLELDMNVRKAIEQVRSRLRLSSLERVMFYRPPGAEHYTAISFPLAEDDDGDGLIETSDGTNIVWDKTVIYHVWKGSPEQLLCTTFSPRDNTLSQEQRRQQLAEVVTAGNGAGTINGAAASTVTVFENLFDWKLWPKGSTFDAYSDSLKRELVPFGSMVLTPGAHSVMFRTTGKNSASSGYKIGLDYVRASPSGSDREAEWQSVLANPSSVAVSRQYMTQGSWSDNYQLFFDASAVGQSVSLALENDCWEEHTFRTPGGSFERTSMKRTSFASTGLEDGCISLDGLGWNWYAANQAPGTNFLLMSDTNYDRCAVRVLIKGACLPDGGFISADGQYPYVWFNGPASYFGPGRKTKIKSIYFGQVDDSAGYASAMNIVTNTLRRMSPFYNDELVLSGWVPLAVATPYYQIQRTNTYAVTFYIESLGVGSLGSVVYRQDPVGTHTHSYVLRNADMADTTDLTWSGKTNLEYSSKLPIIRELYTYYPSNGYYTSGIFDTTKADPDFREILWNMDQGISGTDTLVPAYTAFRFQVRTGDDPYLADAPSWTNVPMLTASGASLASVGSGRYVQFRAMFLSQFQHLSLYSATPILQNVKIRWTGDSRLADISAMVTRGPEYGEFEVLVDGTNLYKGVRIDLSIFKDITGFEGKQERLTSNMMAEIEPRNSGK